MTFSASTFAPIRCATAFVFAVVTLLGTLTALGQQTSHSQSALGIQNPQSISTDTMPKKNAADATADSGNPLFLPPVPYSTGTYCCDESLAVGDLRGDGKLDIVVAITGNRDVGQEGQIAVLLGNGDDTFKSPAVYSSGGYYTSGLAIGDVNNDGKPDIVVSNYYGSDCVNGNCDSSVSVLLGKGDGTFQRAVTYDTGEGQSFSVALADLNGDHNLDIVACDQFGFVSVFLGKGDGTFQPAVVYPTSGSNIFGVAVGDLNGDGRLDIVASGYPGVSVLLGNGDGTFQKPVTYSSGVASGGWASSVAIADLNHDGKPDLVTANYNNDAVGVGVLLGKGDGTFQPAVTYSSGAQYPWSVTVTDVTGSGNPDLLVADLSGDIGVLLGNGDGSFQSPIVYPTIGSNGVMEVVTADLNKDGKPDLVVTVATSVDVMLNSSTQQTSTNTSLTSALNPSVFGQTVTFTAQVMSNSGTPTGTVQLLLGGQLPSGSGTLSNGSVSIPVSNLPAGSNFVTATYQGSPTFAQSTSSPVIQTVTMASSSTTLTASATTIGTGKSVTFTANVASQYGGPASGTVTFYSGTQSLGTVVLTTSKVVSVTTSFPSAGTYTITAKYSGDADNTGSNSAPLTEKVLVSTNTGLTSSVNPAFVGQTITFSATVTSNSGTPPNGESVTFYNGSSVLGTSSLAGGVAMFSTSSLLVGTYSITAVYSGDSTFTSSTSQALTQFVDSTTKSPTNTTLASSLNPSIYGQKVTFSVTVTNNGGSPPTGYVAFTYSGRSIGNAAVRANGVATLTLSTLDANTFPLTAIYKGDKYNLSSTSPVLNQVVNPAISSATLTASPNPSSVGQAVTFLVDVISPPLTPTGPVTFTAGKIVLGTVQLQHDGAALTTSSLPAGSTKVTATFAGDSNMKGSSASVIQVVQQ